MRIVCDGLDLADSVMKVSKGLSSRVTNPILEGIKMVADDEKLTLSATDLEISIEKTIKADIVGEKRRIVMANKCAICGADINLIQTQKLADGNCICRKN